MSKARSRARERAVQALYQWQMAGQNIADIDVYFQSDQDMEKVDIGYFQELLHGVPKNLEELDGELDAFLDRPISQIDPVERAILRMGCYELRFRLDIPYKVVINEAVELAKNYGAEQGHKYVNSIMDKVGQKLRAVEFQAKNKSRSN